MTGSMWMTLGAVLVVMAVFLWISSGLYNVLVYKKIKKKCKSEYGDD